MKKKRIGVIFGGQSGEHEVSLMSSTSIIKVIDREKYDVVMIGITKNGEWLLYNGDVDKIKSGEWEKEGIRAFFPPNANYKGLITFSNGKEEFHPLDIVFPVLHGPRGEDGTIQGLFEISQIPYVSSGVMSSALGMDKFFSKKLFDHAGLPIVKYKVFHKKEILLDIETIIQIVERDLGYPCFVKPCNLGSSVGVSKAHNRPELIDALQIASKYDRRVLVEEFVKAREIELSVFGNNEPKVSIPGEIIPSNEFYDYVAKYFDGGKTKLIIPAPLSESVIKRFQELALKAYRALDCSIYARVDFFYNEEQDKIYINELNTIPGFTHASMYPKLWEATGISYPQLINKLIDLAFERYEEIKQ
ncbi:D-alanine--D-alanine ligase [Koleobacter methoxysyntrophicus]|jgi:D-alanine-D-alanine ligase|uniref:D-alanine--D-alanine ligase n=1 Tax=Koleobacter methoxysyntrophicus TaxID=2751313 RepID=A0A8A0RQS5_9FIRM|nr:D-alanine--D-alanine ligase family protein [Koleobacter methoxysyntrophicus]MDK2901269.1 D-alanine-D-alanine ligase [Thermosediminibacterales bacterium]QSQ10252.1 D-alanine--D-alanine ligase [Koleobacter methoxysyntrophicus]